ncbi:MAG: EamA family transporter [Acidobacteriota bacterium]
MSRPAEGRAGLRVPLNFASVYIFWGSTYLAMRYGVQDMPPALLAGTRFAIAGGLLFTWLRWRRVPLPPARLLGPIAVTGLLLLAGGNWMVTVSVQTVPSGMAAVIIANVPFFMVAIEALRRDGERITPLVAAGLVVGFLGMLILMWPKITALGSRGWEAAPGEIALLAANVSWAFGSIYSKHRVRGVAPLMAVALEMLIAGAALLLIGTLLGEAPRYQVTRRSATAVGWLIVAGSLFGYSSYIWLLGHVPAAKVSTYAYVNPVIAIVLGWLFLGEAVGARMAVGTAVILGGVAAVNIARVRTRA